MQLWKNWGAYLLIAVSVIALLLHGTEKAAETARSDFLDVEVAVLKFLRNNPEVISVEVWSADNEMYSCKYTAGDIDLCDKADSYVTPNFMEENLRTQGYHKAEIQATGFFAKYWIITGPDHWLVWIDVDGNSRITFITSSLDKMDAYNKFIEDHIETLGKL